MPLSNTVLDTRFRAALDRMAERGRLVTYTAPVDPYLEVAGIMKKLDGGPALLFSKVDGYDIPVIGNLLSRTRRDGTRGIVERTSARLRGWSFLKCARMLGRDYPALLSRFQNRVERGLEERERRDGPQASDRGPDSDRRAHVGGRVPPCTVRRKTSSRVSSVLSAETSWAPSAAAMSRIFRFTSSLRFRK